jgi:hypothetical protein
MAVLLVFACKGKPGKEPEQGPGKDSSVLVSGEVLNDDSSGTDTEKYKGPYTKHATFRVRNLVFTVQSFLYNDPNDDYDYFRESNFLILRDPAKKVADTLPLSNSDGYFPGVKIEDMSDSLKFKSLVLKLSTSGSSDMPIDDFVEYKDGRLTELFSLIYCWDIRRKDENTLIGIIHGRDDILYWGYDYPVTINLRDNSVTGEMPDTQAIKHTTTTLEPITVYKVRGEKLTVPYKVKTGTPIFIDTFFRQSGLVRILLGDSTPVFIKEDDLFQKVESNTAG